MDLVNKGEIWGSLLFASHLVNRGEQWCVAYLWEIFLIVEQVQKNKLYWGLWLDHSVRNSFVKFDGRVLCLLRCMIMITLCIKKMLLVETQSSSLCITIHNQGSLSLKRRSCAWQMGRRIDQNKHMLWGVESFEERALGLVFLSVVIIIVAH